MDWMSFGAGVVAGIVGTIVSIAFLLRDFKVFNP